MLRRYSSALVLVSALALAGLTVGCGSAPTVAHRTTIQAGAHGHRTFAVLSQPVNHGELDELVARTMNDVMAARGYVPATDAGSADLLVSFGVLMTDPRVDRSEGMTSSDLSSNPDAPVRTKTLVVMLHDGETREVLWMGVSTTRAIDSELREHAERILDDLRDRIPAAAPAEG